MRFRLVCVFGAAIAGVPGCDNAPEPAPPLTLITAEQPGALMSAFIAPDGVAHLAGGATGGGAGLLLRWQDGRVETVPTPGARAFWWIHGFGANDMWLCGEGGQVHAFDGTTLRRVDSGAPDDATLFGIWGDTPDDLWTVGGSFNAGGPRRVIRRGTPGAFRPVASPATVEPETTYFKVWGAGASDVWIVGNLGVVLRWDGAALEMAAAPPSEIYLTVAGCGPRDVYAVGGGVEGAAFHFDGTSFAALDLGPAPPLAGVACAGGVAFLGGFYGYAARIAGGAVTVLPTPPAIGLLGIHGVAATADRVLMVGGDLLANSPEPGRGFALELPVDAR